MHFKGWLMKDGGEPHTICLHINLFNWKMFWIFWEVTKNISCFYILTLCMYMYICNVFFQFKVPCPAIQSPDSGTVNETTNGTNTIVSYTCAEGYVLKGISERTCLDDGSWTDSDPVCGNFRFNFTTVILDSSIIVYHSSLFHFYFKILRFLLYQFYISILILSF